MRPKQRRHATWAGICMIICTYAHLQARSLKVCLHHHSCLQYESTKNCSLPCDCVLWMMYSKFDCEGPWLIHFAQNWQYIQHACMEKQTTIYIYIYDIESKQVYKYVHICRENISINKCNECEYVNIIHGHSHQTSPQDRLQGHSMLYELDCEDLVFSGIPERKLFMKYPWI